MDDPRPLHSFLRYPHRSVSIRHTDPLRSSFDPTHGSSSSYLYGDTHRSILLVWNDPRSVNFKSIRHTDLSSHGDRLQLVSYWQHTPHSSSLIQSTVLLLRRHAADTFLKPLHRLALETVIVLSSDQRFFTLPTATHVASISGLRSPNRSSYFALLNESIFLHVDCSYCIDTSNPSAHSRSSVHDVRRSPLSTCRIISNKCWIRDLLVMKQFSLLETISTVVMLAMLL